MVQELLERGANCNIKAEVCTGLYIHVLMILMRMISSVFEDLYIGDTLFSDEHDMFSLGCWSWTH